MTECTSNGLSGGQRVGLGDEAVLQRKRHGPVLGQPNVGAGDPAPGRRVGLGGRLIDDQRLVRVLGVQVGE
ncbi:MAG: hypothetical protein ACRD0H_14500, partial [Actinomycetes bacterium]